MTKTTNPIYQATFLDTFIENWPDALSDSRLAKYYRVQPAPGIYGYDLRFNTLDDKIAFTKAWTINTTLNSSIAHGDRAKHGIIGIVMINSLLCIAIFASQELLVKYIMLNE